jgi:hypothetical protein
MTHTCNLSYSGGTDLEDCGSRLSWAKSFQDSISSNKPGVIVHTCHPSYLGSIDSRIVVQGTKPYLRNNPKHKGWRLG